MGGRFPDFIITRDRKPREFVRSEFGGVWHDGMLAQSCEHIKNTTPSSRERS
jgi:hypothetical protein